MGGDSHTSEISLKLRDNENDLTQVVLFS